MRKSLILLSLTFSAALVLSSSCGKTSAKSGTVSSGNSIEASPIANHKVKKLDLGIAESFAVMAYTSITSAPTSSIMGKVGLKPGVRSLISINPTTEVIGGGAEVYAGDDSGDPANYLTLAREDLIAAYRDAVMRVTDKDKLEAYKGKLGGQILPSGIYRWSNGVTINSDITLEGNDSDVFIFQVNGNLEVAPKVRIVMSGGAKAQNVFWQVSGKTTLNSLSVVSGTIISQLTFEMKNLAQLNGRAMVKNGKMVLSQNVITIPGI